MNEEERKIIRIIMDSLESEIYRMCVATDYSDFFGYELLC